MVEQRSERRPLVTWIVIAINVAVFAYAAWKSGTLLELDGDVLDRLGMNGGEAVARGEWWRLLACAFLHAGLLHIAFNMWSLRVVGSVVEVLYGSRRFAWMYVSAALASSLASIAWRPDTASVGASGAIFALLGALIAFFVRYRDRMPREYFVERMRTLVMLVLVNVALGLSIPRIDNAAHMGGLVFGFAFGMLTARGAGGVAAILLVLGGFAGAATWRLHGSAISDVSRLLHSGKAHFEAQEWRDAMNDASAALGFDPHSERALELRLLARRNLGDERGAIADLDAWIALRPDDLELVLTRGHVEYGLASWTAARRDYDEVVRRGEDEVAAEAALFRWLVDVRDGQRAGADRELRAWIEKRGGQGTALQLRTAGCLLGDVSVEDVLREARGTGDSGSFVDAAFVVGESLVLGGDRDRAEDVLKEAVGSYHDARRYRECGRLAELRFGDLEKRAK